MRDFPRIFSPLYVNLVSAGEASGALPEILKRAPIDGLADGPVLAAAVEAAILRGTLDDDAAISLAWLKYVRALKAPVSGVEYGDGTLVIKPPTAKQTLSEALAAPSLVSHVTQVAAVNPFYATLRDAALVGNTGSDPHVRGTLDRLRLIPSKGKLIIVEGIANDHETVTLEDPHGPLDLCRIEDLEAAEAVVRREVLAQGPDVGIVPLGGGPPNSGFVRVGFVRVRGHPRDDRTLARGTARWQHR